MNIGDVETVEKEDDTETRNYVYLMLLLLAGEKADLSFKIRAQRDGPSL